MDTPIILIDGSYYIHKVYHAYPSLTTSDGYPVWVIYGVTNIIKKLLIKYQPTHMVIVFDFPGKTFRDDLFQEYKSNRVALPLDVYSQIPPLYKIIKSMGISTLSVPYVEADDVIATLATFYEKLNKSILIITGDKDMAQIVSPKINLINTPSNITLTPIEIEKKFGVPPNLIADYLALTGDRSDNIPGIPGIGNKTSKILLNTIGDINTLYKKLDCISSLKIRGIESIKKKLVTYKELAWLSYKLAVLKIDVPLKKTDYIISIQKLDIQNLLLLFKKYEFNQWITELQSGTWLNKNKYSSTLTHITKQSTYKCIHHKNNINTAYHHYNKKHKKNNIDYVIYNNKMLNDWIKNNNSDDIYIFNIHSDNSNVFKTNIISLCISAYNNTTCIIKYIYIPINNHIQQNYEKNYLNFQEVFYILKPIFENPNIKKIGQNMKFNHAILNQYDINLVGTIFDVTLEFYVLYGTSNYQHIKHFLDINTFHAIFNFKKKYNNYINSYTITDIRNVQLESSCSIKFMNAIFNLHKILWSKIKKNDKLKKIFENIEIPLTSVLSRIESYGVLIDKDLLNSYSIELNSRLQLLQKEAYKLTGISFNLSSTKQLQKILYDQQKLPILKKTPHGSPSTNEEVLKKLSKMYSIPKIILEHRSLSKLKSTYVNKLISMINEQSNRIHTSYNQIRTSTGRLSSANPNLQNIPNRNYDGRKIRQAFIAPSNFLIVSADYSQIELRIIAHLSHDPKLINDFINKKDIHSTTASEIFVTKLNLVTQEQRQKAKTINFGLIYGMSAFGLSKQLSVTLQEAQKYVDRYFNRYSGIMQYMKNIKNEVNKYGYVSTLNGRRLYLPDIYSSNISQKKSAERAAINAPMQGSAADIIKKAMVSIDHWLYTHKIPARMIIQVHDELVFEVQNDYINHFVKQIKKLMEESFILDVPLKVEIGVGKNWEKAH